MALPYNFIKISSWSEILSTSAKAWKFQLMESFSRPVR